jgi:hypothetical protein
MDLLRPPPPKNARRPRPKVLTDDHVKTVFSRITPSTSAGNISIHWSFVRWDRLHNGALGAIYADPHTGQHYRWAVDFKTGTLRNLGPVTAKPRRSNSLLPPPFRF